MSSRSCRRPLKLSGNGGTHRNSAHLEAVEQELLFWTHKIINGHPTKTAVAKQVPPLESPAQGLPQGHGMQENKSWWSLNTGIFYS